MIGIIGAMASEVQGLKAIMENTETFTISSVEFYVGNINGTAVVIAEAGIGKVNAAVTAQTMILKYNTKYIINIGVAGGLNSTLNIGDIVVADKVVEHDMDTTPCGDDPGYITGINMSYMPCDKRLTDLLTECSSELGIHTIIGTIASGDQFICTDSQRKKIIDTFNASAAEMEGASIGHVCTMNNVSFAVLRAISDNANGDSTMDFPSFCELAANNSIKIISLMLKKIGGKEIE